MGYTISQDPSGLIICKGRISEFGDAADVQSGGDNGIGAWGYRCVDNPLAPYCSLPISLVKQFSLPGYCLVSVSFSGRTVRCFLADKGPSDFTGRLIDVCPSVMKRLHATTDDVVKVYIKPHEMWPEDQRC